MAAAFVIAIGALRAVELAREAARVGADRTRRHHPPDVSGTVGRTRGAGPCRCGPGRASRRYGTSSSTVTSRRAQGRTGGPRRAIRARGAGLRLRGPGWTKIPARAVLLQPASAIVPSFTATVRRRGMPCLIDGHCIRPPRGPLARPCPCVWLIVGPAASIFRVIDASVAFRTGLAKRAVNLDAESPSLASAL